MKVTIKSKLVKFGKILDNVGTDYISLTYIKHLLSDTGVDIAEATTTIDGEENQPLGYYDIINGVGKEDQVYIRSEVKQWYDSNETIKSIVSAKPEPKPRTIKEPTTFELKQVDVTTLSNDAVDQLVYMFPRTKVTYGVTVQLQSILPLFRQYNRNEELRKKDLSSFLLGTKTFVKTPTGLYTYVNRIPLTEIEKQFVEVAEESHETI